ncbi:nitrate- and nitrite sensing domain-containing protein [Streptomyces sp. NPDC002004]
MPIVVLLGLWTFAMVSVTGELRALVRLQDVYETFGTPVDTAVGQIQIERRMSAAYLGEAQRGGTPDVAALTRQQRRTDRAVAAMRVAVGDRSMRDELTARQRGSLDAMTRSVSGLEDLRTRVMARNISWDRAVDAYTAMVEPTFDVQSQLTALQAGQLAREAQVVVELVRVREYVSREDALVAGARAAGTVTDRQYDALTGTIEDRRVFHRTYVADLPGDSRKLFHDYEHGAVYRQLTHGEDALLRAGSAGAARAVAADSWRTTTDHAVLRYRELCTDSALNAASRGRAFAYHELIKSAVVGGTGLLAVGLSIWFSVASGRRISRRLEALRDAADVLATQQLPEVMRKLSAGDEVDAAAAAPPLDFGAPEQDLDEIGQVGTALNTARRAAVEAAVKQATLRRGVFAVLLNIARRNQALVHRQAKLVDTLERRTTDADILEELFRIDHLTTRMRRHAEGLIILSGAVPGRRWRRPVPVVDVVAAAVGEIEDYTRVVVPPMPPVGITADAVADVVHLLAELIENATVFSPPHTQVTMRTGEAQSGFVLEIDDRGLGMDAEELKEAHHTLSRPGDFDPVQDERLGLYVVGRLAERHGIGVTLMASPYGGTTAVVLLPTSLLAPVDGSAPAGESGPAAAGTDGTGTPARGTGHAAPAGTAGHTPAAAGAPAAGTGAPTTAGSPGPAAPRGGAPAPAPVRAVPLPRRTGQPLLRPVPDLDGAPAGQERDEEPAPGDGHPDAAASLPEAVTFVPEAVEPEPDAPALPTRVRQASLAAPLREEPPAPGRSDAPEPSAEEMRAVFGAFQRGLDRGRAGEPARGHQRNPDARRTRTTDEGTDDDA